jgi:hypothetical protein
MLSDYSHVRMEATRRALDRITTRQREADEKRTKEVEQVVVPSGDASVTVAGRSNRECLALC